MTVTGATTGGVDRGRYDAFRTIVLAWTVVCFVMGSRAGEERYPFAQRDARQIEACLVEPRNDDAL